MSEIYEQIAVIVDDIKRNGDSNDTDVYVDAIVGVVKSTLDAEKIKEALEADSNDAEHDALVWVADALGIKYTITYD